MKKTKKEPKNNLVDIVQPEVPGRACQLRIQVKNKARFVFMPKLSAIRFHVFKGFLFVTLVNDDLKNTFEDFIKDIYEDIANKDDVDQIIKDFNKGLEEFLKLFTKEQGAPRDKVMGLYGELLELKDRLDAGGIHQKVVDSWHRPEPANHDFEDDDGSLEVKTTGRTNQKITIQSVYQLQSIEDKPLRLRVLVLDVIDNSARDSLGELFQEIYDLLEDSCKEVFARKCYKDKKFRYLGPEMKMPFKITPLESNYYLVDQQRFPRIGKDTLIPGVSVQKYFVDLSSIDQFKEN